MKNDLRVTLTKQLLKDELLRCLTNKTLSKITVSDLCREAGVNRATFYNHYDSPKAVMKDIADDHALKIREIYYAVKQASGTESAAIETCLEYLYEQKSAIRILFSANAENCITDMVEDILKARLAEILDSLPEPVPRSKDDAFLYSVITSSAVYGLLKVWMTMKIEKTPKEIFALLKTIFSGEMYAAMVK